MLRSLASRVVARSPAASLGRCWYSSNTSSSSDSWEKKDKNIKHYGAIENALEEGVIDEKVSPKFWPRPGSSTKATYKPFDLAMAASPLGHKRKSPVRKADKFKTLGLNPLALWKSPSALSNYITSSGNIIPGYIHGTKGKNQRRLAKAIRRCQAAGLLSTVHRGTNDLGK